MAGQIAVVGGVDTHTDFHQAAVIDTIGRHLATAYGSGLARLLRVNEVIVVDVDRPDRKVRRANGKADPVARVRHEPGGDQGAGCTVWPRATNPSPITNRVGVP